MQLKRHLLSLFNPPRHNHHQSHRIKCSVAEVNFNMLRKGKAQGGGSSLSDFTITLLCEQKVEKRGNIFRFSFIYFSFCCSY
jgi:hypothetical protein